MEMSSMSGCEPEEMPLSISLAEFVGLVGMACRHGWRPAGELPPEWDTIVVGPWPWAYRGDGGAAADADDRRRFAAALERGKAEEAGGSVMLGYFLDAVIDDFLVRRAGNAPLHSIRPRPTDYEDGDPGYQRRL